MPSFISLIANDLVHKYQDRFQDVTVVFPNKRAGLFLAEELSRMIDHPVWMPEIISLTDFICKYTGFKNIEELPLIVKLYKSYRKVSGTEEKFEDFYFWGNMLLDDFDDIDKFLIDAKDLFSNLVSLKELEYNFPYLTPEQIHCIQNFWNTFNPDKFSPEQQEFLKVWNKLYPTYLDFREELFKEKLCYEGMGERYFCEHIEELDIPEEIIFAGFNALNICEKQIFSHFRDNHQAHFYWDYDIYYTSAENHEAGYFLRENFKLFPNELGLEHFNNFRYNGKQIEYISVPSSVGQAKLIPTLLTSLPYKKNHDTAVVMCDERMLIPVIHSIPDDIHKINITMGYPAQNTSIAALVSLLGDLQNYSKQENGQTFYYYKPVIALLNHKLIKELCPDDINQITDYIHRKNIIYVTEKSLQFNDITKAIFSSPKEKLTDYLLHILNLLAIQGGNTADPIEREFIFSIYTCIQSLQNLFETEEIIPENKLYIQIIKKVIHSTTIPFSGEPLQGMQLMGLLETRMLDFKNLIILCANEGILPKNTVPSSFIPYNLRVGFRLPTPEYRDALFAYNFYRLLQRAEHVKLLYTSGNKGVNTGEMSRYLYQIKYESGLTIKESNFQNHISIQDNLPIQVRKNDGISQVLQAYTNSAENPLSPSALNTYLDCGVKFYFKYIAQIKEKEEITEELDHRLLGNIFHECSQSLYATISNKEITPEALDSILKNEPLIDRHIQESYSKVYDRRIFHLLDTGSNDLILNVIKKYIRKMLEFDKKLCPFLILAMEQKYCFPLSIPGSPSPVYIGGYIDRVDQVASGIRIIDYKTGADMTTFKNIASVFDPKNTTRNKAAFQTMLYCLMFDHTQPTEMPLIPGIYSTKLLFNKDYNPLLKCDRDYINNFRQYKEEFLEHLSLLLEELYSSQNSFKQTDNEQKCRTCSYSCICRK